MQFFNITVYFIRQSYFSIDLIFHNFATICPAPCKPNNAPPIRLSIKYAFTLATSFTEPKKEASNTLLSNFLNLTKPQPRHESPRRTSLLTRALCAVSAGKTARAASARGRRTTSATTSGCRCARGSASRPTSPGSPSASSPGMPVWPGRPLGCPFTR